MPKAARGAGSGQPRPHSRSSSATRLGANLHFTQKDPQPPKHTDKPKKAVYVHEAHTTKTAPPFARVNSNQRVHSKEQLAKRPAPLHQHQHQQPQPRPKNAKGFTIASPSENADDDDDDWESSESGAATPNQQDSDSDTASEEENPNLALLNLPPQPRAPIAAAPPTHQVGFPATNDSFLARVATARPSDFEHLPRIERNTPRPPKQIHQPQMPPPPPPTQPQPQYPPMERRSTAQHESENLRESANNTSQSRHKRHSRPPSTHSTKSRNEHPLRPHPLIRGISHGQAIPVPKPSPLAPLTVLPVESGFPQVSSSPNSVHDSIRNYLSSSPTSVKTSSGSSVSADFSHSVYHPSQQDRRTSFSSARSVNTIPVQTTIIREVPWMHDRTRTLSTMSSSSLSAALSSLTHLPSVTRPPSPQSVVFFPPVNPHANVEAIHPLLPVPYLQNHLTVLSRRTPIRESFDRVMRAKNTR